MKLIDENAAVPTLEAQDMHGPVEVSITVFAKKKTGEMGRLTFTHPSGLVPTQAELLELVKAAQEAMAGLDATYPTKAEFVAHITKRETGASIPMAGSMEYVPVGEAIPKAMLVHAIKGVLPMDMDMEEKYIAQGLGGLTRSTVRSFKWGEQKLESMPHAELLSLYNEITAGVSNG